MSGRHVAHGRGGGAAGLGLLRLVRRGLPGTRGPAALLAVLAALTATYLVATPRLESVALDRAVGDTAAEASAPEREIRFRAPAGVVDGRPVASTQVRPGPAPPFAAVDAAVREVLGPTVLALLGNPTVAAQSDLLSVTRGGAPVVPDGAKAVVRVQSGLDTRVRWLAGGPPGAPSAERDLETVGGDPHRVAIVPVAVAEPTARTWSLRVGEQLELGGIGDLTPAAVVVSGVYTPLDPADGFWQAEPTMTGLATIPTSQGGVITAGALVAAPGSYGPMTDALWRAPAGDAEPPESPVLQPSWRYPLDPARLTAQDLPALRSALVRLDTSPRLDGLTTRPLVGSTGIAGLLDRYEAAVRAAGVLTSFATTALTALTVLVLALAAVVAMRRRSGQARLLRARGAGLGEVLLQLGTGATLPVLPVVALAAALVVLLVPGRSTSTTWVGVTLVALVPLLAAVATLGAAVATAERTEHTEEAARRGRVVRRARRVVGELTVLALAVLAVTTVRSRGSEIAGGRVDLYAALAPVLVAGAAALLVVRVVPGPLRLAARVASRGRGLTGFLGLARAARTGAGAVLPVLAVVVGAAVLSLLASLALATSDERTTAAYRSVGATVRVDALRIDADDVAALEARPGVRAVAAAYVDEGAVVTAERSIPVLVVGTDLAAYRAVLEGTPLALSSTPPATSTSGGGGLPAVLGPLPGGDVADALLVVRQIRVPLDPLATTPTLVRGSGAADVPTVLVPLDRLRESVPVAQPNTVFVATDGAAAARALGDLADPSSLTPSGRVVGVADVPGVERDTADRALPAFVAGTYVAGAALAVVLVLVGVLLLLTATRPDRAALVVRLRTMGLPHGGERSLAWTEVLPVVAVAAVVGALTGTLAPVLVGPAVDLTPLTGGAAAPALRPDALAALAAGGLVLALGGLALVLDAAAARRGRLADHLRRGDTA